MAIEENIEFGDDGKVKVAEPIAIPRALQSDDDEDGEGIAQIALMIADPTAPLADIMRLIALQMAELLKKMTSKREILDRSGMSQRDLNDQIKAYRELQRTLTESDALSKKDVLNFDGPKFQFVFGEIIGLFQKALKGAGLGDEDSRNVMKQFGDLVKTNDESLRRELNKI